MKKFVYGLVSAMTGILMFFGFLYMKEHRMRKKVGGRLVKVNYRYTKVFDE